MAYRDTLERLYEGMAGRAEKKRIRQQTPAAAFSGASFSDTLISGLASDSRFFGIADYILKADIESFRQNLCTSTKLIRLIFTKYNNGEPIDDSFVSMNSHPCLTDALAAGEIGLATETAKLLGSRDKIEQEHTLKFVRALGYLTKSVILNDAKLFDEWAEAVERGCEDKYYAFEGCYDVCRAFRENDESGVIEGVEKVADLHKSMCKRNGWHFDTEDELLSVYGIGMANLGRSRGIAVPGFRPYVPEDLLIEVA